MKGEILGLIGPNGSGKSTTFNVISGSLCPQRRFDPARRAQEIGGLQAPHAICQQRNRPDLPDPAAVPPLSILENATLAGRYYGQGSERIDPQPRPSGSAHRGAGALIGLPRDPAPGSTASAPRA